jgi:hypothetical protein
MAVKTAPRLDTAEIARVMRQLDRPGRPDWCGWQVHRSTEDPGHVLITCDVPDSWALTMPGRATHQVIAQRLMRYGNALQEAGFGIAMWKWRGWPDVLIVAADQATADEIAPDIRKHLTELNPEESA